MTWTRICDLDAAPRRHATERWEYRREEETIVCPVEVTTGKPFDVLGLKGTDLVEVRNYAAFLARTAERMYGDPEALRVMASCPCCGAATGDAGEAIAVFGVSYHRCQSCGHGFVGAQPTEAALSALFTESDAHSDTYVDRESAELRLSQIIAPKIDWTLGVYERLYGRRPDRMLDVGAGGGHFVAGVSRVGIAAEGIEKSRASRAFAREAFDIELSDADFLAGETGEPVDIVTFWGLLEYVPEPRRFLEAAHRRLSADGGLLVIEVPRLNALGTAVQRNTSDTVARHMDPTSHVNAFTDASLATALVDCGFRPVAAWYFGMDVYELLIQAALRLDEPRVLDRLADLIPDLQDSLDHGRRCDDLVVAARPVASAHPLERE